MSLNGLDGADVQDAYQTAVTEAGGWLLLKYTSRDEVALLGRGKLGVSEARNAITAYTDASPLYGLIIYRRRKVLIKYIPENTSRLLQVRTAVHFQDVIERFAPHETILEISTGDALNDTSLAASFPLHTASPSPVPSRRLQEISEDAEDGGPAPSSPASSAAPSLYNAPRTKSERKSDLLRAERQIATSKGASDGATLTAKQPHLASAASKPSFTQLLVRDEAGKTSVTPLDSSRSLLSVADSVIDSIPSSKAEVTSSQTVTSVASGYATRSLNDQAHGAVPPEVPAKSNQQIPNISVITERDLPDLPSDASLTPGGYTRSEEGVSTTLPKYDEPYDFSKFDELFKPKVKLAPRPVIDTEKARSTVQGVAGLPANLRHNVKKQEQARESPVRQRVPLSTFTPLPPPPIPNTPEYNPRPVSRGSIKSVPTHKSTGAVQDKRRLMKAMELRKKQMRKSNPSMQPQLAPAEAESSTEPPVPTQAPLKDMRKAWLERSVGDETERTQSLKADSGIGYERLGAEDAAVEREEEEPISGAGCDSHAKSETTEQPDNDESSSSEVASSQTTQIQITQPPATASPTVVAIVADDERPSEPPAGASSAETKVEDHTSIANPDSPTAQGVINDYAADEDMSPTASIAGDLQNDFQDSTRSSKPTGIANRRRGFVEPLQINVAMSSGNPDDFASDDEDFLEELQSATVQEAKPAFITRSPTVTSFERRPSQQSLNSALSDHDSATRNNSIVKLSSSPDMRLLDVPELVVPESLAPTPESPESPEIGQSEVVVPDSSKTPMTYTPTGALAQLERADALSSVSRNVSSGISRRIQALAEVTNRDSVSSGYSTAARPLTPETVFLQQDQRDRKIAFRPQGNRPTSYKRTNSNRTSMIQGPATVASNENAPVLSFNHDPLTNRNSVSVTARIIRPNPENEPVNEPQLDPDVQLNQEYIPSSSETDLTPTNSNTLGSRSRAESAASTNSLATASSSNDIRTMHSSSRFGRHSRMPTPTSPSAEDFPPPPTARTHSIASTEGTAANSKEGSRTSRFFKRMSNLSVSTGGRRRSSKPYIDSPNDTSSTTSSRIFNRSSIMSEKITEKVVEHPDMPPAAVVGDLNVQFPEALLWKRRIVTIDDAGYLTFSIAQAMEIHKAVAVRKHHLSEFKPPYFPDAEQQELPHSVFLEFADAAMPDLRGTTVQAACEDAMTHRAVMHLLRSYHKAWTSPA